MNPIKLLLAKRQLKKKMHEVEDVGYQAPKIDWLPDKMKRLKNGQSLWATTVFLNMKCLKDDKLRHMDFPNRCVSCFKPGKKAYPLTIKGFGGQSLDEPNYPLDKPMTFKVFYCEDCKPPKRSNSYSFGKDLNIAQQVRGSFKGLVGVIALTFYFKNKKYCESFRNLNLSILGREWKERDMRFR